MAFYTGFKIFILSIFEWRFTQVLLYIDVHFRVNGLTFVRSDGSMSTKARSEANNNIFMFISGRMASTL